MGCPVTLMQDIHILADHQKSFALQCGAVYPSAKECGCRAILGLFKKTKTGIMYLYGVTLLGHIQQNKRITFGI